MRVLLTDRERLITIACQWLAGWTWGDIAAYHGWGSGAAARRWAMRRMRDGI